MVQVVCWGDMGFAFTVFMRNRKLFYVCCFLYVRSESWCAYLKRFLELLHDIFTLFVNMVIGCTYIWHSYIWESGFRQILSKTNCLSSVCRTVCQFVSMLSTNFIFVVCMRNCLQICYTYFWSSTFWGYQCRSTYNFDPEFLKYPSVT